MKYVIFTAAFSFAIASFAVGNSGSTATGGSGTTSTRSGSPTTSDTTTGRTTQPDPTTPAGQYDSSSGVINRSTTSESRRDLDSRNRRARGTTPQQERSSGTQMGTGSDNSTETR